jgi:predicted RNA polymerase sigma factor
VTPDPGRRTQNLAFLFELDEEARDADLRAIALTANPAERALLEERIGLP